MYWKEKQGFQSIEQRNIQARKAFSKWKAVATSTKKKAKFDKPKVQ